MVDVPDAESETLRYYYVVRPTVDKTAPLPSHPLAWTTIAYVFWDDLDPAVLTNQQQQALLDWLHWGGQLVISGPARSTSSRARSWRRICPANRRRRSS